LLHPAHEQALYAGVLHYSPHHQCCHDAVPTCVNEVLAKCGPLLILSTQDFALSTLTLNFEP